MGFQSDCFYRFGVQLRNTPLLCTREQIREQLSRAAWRPRPGTNGVQLPHRSAGSGWPASRVALLQSRHDQVPASERGMGEAGGHRRNFQGGQLTCARSGDSLFWVGAGQNVERYARLTRHMYVLNFLHVRAAMRQDKALQPSIVLVGIFWAAFTRERAMLAQYPFHAAPAPTTEGLLHRVHSTQGRSYSTCSRHSPAAGNVGPAAPRPGTPLCSCVRGSLQSV